MAKEFEMNEEKVLSPNELDTVAGGAGNAGETVIAYYEDGRTETLISQGDGTVFKTLKGAVYYLGLDGVYRCKGYADLYAKKPVK